MIQSIRNVTKRDQKGFTLIELLVVIAIIAILAALILVALNAAQKGSRDSRRQSDINQYKTALANYYSSNGSYPNPGPSGSTPVSASTQPCTSLVSNFLSSCLTGPNNATNFYYSSDGTTFTICAISERDSTKAFAAGPTSTDNNKTGVTSNATCTGVS